MFLSGPSASSLAIDFRLIPISIVPIHLELFGRKIFSEIELLSASPSFFQAVLLRLGRGTPFAFFVSFGSIMLSDRPWGITKGARIKSSIFLGLSSYSFFLGEEII
jgi:hypothetical protein